jgi:hypothetical protein
MSFWNTANDEFIVDPATTTLIEPISVAAGGVQGGTYEANTAIRVLLPESGHFLLPLWTYRGEITRDPSVGGSN